MLPGMYIYMYVGIVHTAAAAELVVWGYEVCETGATESTRTTAPRES